MCGPICLRRSVHSTLSQVTVEDGGVKYMVCVGEGVQGFT